jgi:hypothetical protein
MADNTFLGKYHCMIRLGEYSRPNPMDTGDFKTTKYIKLPLPLELRDDTPVALTNLDLTSTGDLINGSFAGGAAAYALRKSGDVISGGASAVGGALAGTIGGMGGEALGDAAQSAVGGGIAEAFPPDQVASAIQQYVGAAPNPNPSIMFTGPTLREFNFSWTFYPRNLQESRSIKNVVETLKRAALPATTFSKSASVLSYPNMVQMNFYPWDSGGKAPYGWSKNSIIKMKKCMMQAVNVNYAPSNVPAFFGDGESPVAIGLSINLREIEYMMSHDWGGSKGSKTEADLQGQVTAQGTNLLNQSTQILTPANADNPQDAAPT